MESTSQELLLSVLEFFLRWVEAMGWMLLGAYLAIIGMVPEIAPGWMRSLVWGLTWIGKGERPNQSPGSPSVPNAQRDEHGR